MIRLKQNIILILAITIALVTIVACGEQVAKEHTFALNIEGGQLTGSEPVLVVSQSDVVTIKVEVDEPLLFHLHGYDIEQEVVPGTAGILNFIAEATGSFPFTMHGKGGNGHGEGAHTNEPMDGHDGGAHGELFTSDLLESGDTFTFQVPDETELDQIPFHSHLHASVAGVISLSKTTTPSIVEVEIRDKMAHPHDVVVGPGGSITWTNNDSVPHIIVNGPHPGAVHEAAGTGHEATEAGHGDGVEATHSEEEIELGRLEVRP